MEALLQDLRHALRMLMRKPGFSAVVIVMLGLCLAANGLVFSIVDGVLLRPLPYNRPERLVTIWETSPSRGVEQVTVSSGNYFDLRAQSQAFGDMAAFAPFEFLLQTGKEPIRIPGAYCSDNLFALLGVRPILGRTFQSHETDRRAVLIGKGLWEREFGSDPNVVGRLFFDKPGLSPDRGFIVVGVMPSDFQFPYPLYGEPAQLWLPGLAPADSSLRIGHNYYVLGRLKPGVAIQQARAEADVIMKRLEQSYPATNAGWGVSVIPLREAVVHKARSTLLVLMGAVALVLLIACGNVANLLLARAAGRRKETAIRLALGSSRRRLVQQFLAENVVLALSGGALGCLLLFWGVPVVASLAPRSVAIPRLGNVAINVHVVLFTFGTSLLAGFLSGLVPAICSARTNIGEMLKGMARAGLGGHLSRSMDSFALAGIVLAFVLLVGTGLMIRSFRKLQSVELGFDPKNLVTARMTLSWRQSSQAAAADFYERFFERLSTLPGVHSAAAVDSFPLHAAGFELEGDIAARPAADRPVAEVHMVTPTYFKTMGVRVAMGRAFAPADHGVIVINESMARRYWGAADPLGKHLIISEHGKTPWMIAGVVSDIRRFGLADAPRPEIYISFFERKQQRMSLLVRTTDPTYLVPALRSLASQLDKDVLIEKVTTVENLLSDSRAPLRFVMGALAFFGLIAGALALLGVYGVVSHSVAQRTSEMGLRFAVGAQPRDLFGLIIRKAMTLAFAGVVMGWALAMACTGLLSRFLYNVGPTDLVTFSTVAIAFLSAAALAGCVPARRAAKTDPLSLIRNE